MKNFLTAISIAAVLSGCTNQGTYNSLQGARENECRQIVDTRARDQCFDDARKPYGKYEQERNESRKN